MFGAVLTADSGRTPNMLPGTETVEASGEHDGFES